MCGIAGLLSTRPLDDGPALAQRLDAALAHRGPDDAGRWHEAGTLLVHRRLAILDLSPDSHQPMASACGRWRLVFNGEIYNYRELRHELRALGHRFASHGDTEVLLQLLIRFGPAALDRLRGMYAFCLWDRQLGRALLARDPFGIKPLYLHQGAAGELLFASELRTLLASGLVPRRLDPAGLNQFLQLGHLSHTTTLVEGVQALPPGHLAQWQNGSLQIQPHWLPSYAAESQLSYPDLVARTRAALQSSVKLHLRSDVPVGLFLSGGLDSSALLALAAERGLRTLSIGFREAGFDESARAEALARAFAADHTQVQWSAERAVPMLEPFLAAMDQPSVDGFNTFCVSQLAHEQGLKVVLSGLGGDELFGGYPSFQRLPLALAVQQLAARCPGLVGLLARAPRGSSQRLAAGLRDGPSIAGAFQMFRGLFAPAEAEQLLRHWDLAPHHAAAQRPCLQGAARDLQDPERFPSPQDALAWLETSSYMTDQLLRDSDALSMAWGLELRLPLVDAALFRALAAQPARHRLASGKRLLRDAVPELQPVLAAAPKQGFAFPFQTWFDQPSGPMAHRLRQLSPSVPGAVDLQPWARRWGLLVLEQWLQRHLGMSLG